MSNDITPGTTLDNDQGPTRRMDALVAELGQVQGTIRSLDPLDDSTDGHPHTPPTVLDLMTSDYRILQHLRHRQTLLRESIRLLKRDTMGEGHLDGAADGLEQP
jgi:hypothetical protein